MKTRLYLQCTHCGQCAVHRAMQTSSSTSCEIFLFFSFIAKSNQWLLIFLFVKIFSLCLFIFHFPILPCCFQDSETLLSLSRSEGGAISLSLGLKTKRIPSSPCLLIHFHGGGFVAQTSKSHEVRGYSLITVSTG